MRALEITSYLIENNTRFNDQRLVIDDTCQITVDDSPSKLCFKW